MNRYGLRDYGIYFKQSQTDDLLARLEEALADPALLKARGAEQQAHVTRTYSWDRVVDDYVSIFSGQEIESTSSR